MKTLLPSAAALALGSVLCVPSLAMAQPTLNVADTATLTAGGGGAIVSVQITCPTATNTVYVGVNFVQEAGALTASGYGDVGGINSTITCTPEPQTVEVNVTASGPNKYQPGAVAAHAPMIECYPVISLATCEGAYQTKSVELVQPSASKAGRRQTLPAFPLAR